MGARHQAWVTDGQAGEAHLQKRRKPHVNAYRTAERNLREVQRLPKRDLRPHSSPSVHRRVHPGDADHGRGHERYGNGRRNLTSSAVGAARCRALYLLKKIV